MFLFLSLCRRPFYQFLHVQFFNFVRLDQENLSWAKKKIKNNKCNNCKHSLVHELSVLNCACWQWSNTSIFPLCAKTLKHPKYVINVFLKNNHKWSVGYSFFCINVKITDSFDFEIFVWWPCCSGIMVNCFFFSTDSCNFVRIKCLMAWIWPLLLFFIFYFWEKLN